jgi:predicted MPP superfamily phosphohydrolase
MNINENQPTVLLHHGPDGIKYANKAGVDLYLAGHTHAGQLWPATHVAKMIFEYNKGLRTFEDTQVYVSQGTGTFGPPMRVGTQSELTILNIKPAP